jgi:hypothetical protein
MERDELAERLSIIESMIAEGQRSAGQWGWAWVLWGTGHTLAILWSELLPGRPGLAWLVLMPLCGLIMALGAMAVRRKSGKSSALDRLISAVWWAFGISLAVAWGIGATRGLYPDAASFYFVFYLLLGGANYVTAVALRLPIQRLVAGLWWAAGILTAFFPELAPWILLGSAVVCEILFGFYLMNLEKEHHGLG